MKKIFNFSIVLLVFCSCNYERNLNIVEEQSRIEEISARKTQVVTKADIEKFEKALSTIFLKENRPTEQERVNQISAELSDKRKDILIPAAISLIESTGISENEILQQTNGDRNLILSWAFKIFTKK